MRLGMRSAPRLARTDNKGEKENDGNPICKKTSMEGCKEEEKCLGGRGGDGAGRRLCLQAGAGAGPRIKPTT